MNMIVIRSPTASSRNSAPQSSSTSSSHPNPNNSRPSRMLSPTRRVVHEPEDVVRGQKKKAPSRTRSSTASRKKSRCKEVTPPSSPVGPPRPTIKSLAQHLRNQRLARLKAQQEQQEQQEVGTTEPQRNVLEWMATCPGADVLGPKILAFCGPQTASALSRTNRHWRSVLESDVTWKVLSEELYKWKPGDPTPRSSWKEYYRMHPCVPIDFSTLQGALSVATAVPPRMGDANSAIPKSEGTELVQSVRVLVRPGTYSMDRTIHIQGLPFRRVQISIEAMELPSTAVKEEEDKEPSLSLEANFSSPSRAAAQKAALALARFKRRSLDASLLHHAPLYREQPSAVVFTSRFKKRNQPLFRVVSGELKIKHCRLQHQCLGIDIWNGNAALHVKPTDFLSESSLPTASPATRLLLQRHVALGRATAVLEHCEVTSFSGRGIVATDGGRVSLQDSYVHDCAATGIYVGGAGTRADLQQCDVLANGTGNLRTGGIARGHSGVYVEQGHVSIQDSNVSQNTASGISVISRGHASLHLKESDVLGNGFSPLELPDQSLAAQQEEHNNWICGDTCRIAVVGNAKGRSSLYQTSKQREWTDDVWGVPRERGGFGDLSASFSLLEDW